MWTLVVITMALWGVDAKGIKLHLSDEIKSMLEKSDWDHQGTALSIHGPMTLDVQANFKLKKGQVFLKSWVSRHKDCAHIKKHRPLSRDGVYTIYPTLGTNKTVFCDMTTDGGGWTVIQKRIDGETDFYRNWTDYKNGFGHADHEYWLGNDAIHALTKDKNQILRIDMMKFSREKGHATYSSFFVDNEANKYKLTLGSFNGTKGLGDSLRISNNMYFSTYDRDNDKDDSRHCVQRYKAPGWMNGCFRSNLNDEMKSMLEKSNWDHQDTALSIHGPMTLDLQSSFKLKEGQVFLKSRVSRHKDCAQIKIHRPLSRDGVYTIYPTPGTNKTVFCDMTTDGGGWTVIQRRIDGEIDFYRNWKDYKNGFGHADHEYWLGNDAIHALTKDKNQILRIDMVKFSREKGHATYSSFFVDNEANKYKLKLGSFNGTKGLGDSFSSFNNMYFSTKDRDNDKRGGDHCVQKYKSPGWMNGCFSANLNGVYKTSLKDYTELHWQNWGKVGPLRSAKMMIRPKQTN
uniref:Ficolin-2 n=1 Tax=Magallana gigas TaxID=29159 RepID=K1QNY5_MAGGI